MSMIEISAVLPRGWIVTGYAVDEIRGRRAFQMRMTQIGGEKNNPAWEQPQRGEKGEKIAGRATPHMINTRQGEMGTAMRWAKQSPRV